MRPLPQKVVENLPTKSAKIRALAQAGFERTEIAHFLNIRYQHVRNVLVQSSVASVKRSGGGKGADLPVGSIEPWPIEKLVAAGFQLISQCESLGPDTFGYSAKAPASRGVYAFAVDGIVQYVGLSQSGLQTTMSHYAYGYARQRTRARVKQLILDCLAQGKSVSVLVAHPPQLDWNGLAIDGSAGLEAGLIRAIKPPWNMQGKA